MTLPRLYTEAARQQQRVLKRLHLPQRRLQTPRQVQRTVRRRLATLKHGRCTSNQMRKEFAWDNKSRISALMANKKVYKEEFR